MAEEAEHAAGPEITPEMVEAAAAVILDQCGGDRSTISWARLVAEDVLQAALRSSESA